MTAALQLVEEATDRPTAQDALEELLADSSTWWQRFEGVCREGVLELRGSVLEFREALLARGHRFATHAEQFEETFVSLLAVAEDLLPETPAATRARLRERVRDDVAPRPGGGVRTTDDVDARRAVEVVLAFEDTLFDEVVLAAGSGHVRLYLVARRIRDALAKTGREYPVEEVEDELWMLVREFFPDAPAAAPDTARVGNLWARAQTYVEEHDPDGVLGDEVRQEYEVRVLHAIRDHDPPECRAALRELCRAARDAAREGDGNGGDGNEG